MECKVLQEEEPEALRRDLIETLWNVKRSAVHFRLTLQLRFNRDIVECKGVYYNKLMGEISGFNRDIVECKAEVARLLALTYYLI